MADGEAWLDALGEELRRSGKIIPALAAAQAKLAEANVDVEHVKSKFALVAGDSQEMDLAECQVCNSH